MINFKKRFIISLAFLAICSSSVFAEVLVVVDNKINSIMSATGQNLDDRNTKEDPKDVQIGQFWLNVSVNANGKLESVRAGQWGQPGHGFGQRTFSQSIGEPGKEVVISDIQYTLTGDNGDRGIKGNKSLLDKSSSCSLRGPAFKNNKPIPDGSTIKVHLLGDGSCYAHLIATN